MNTRTKKRIARRFGPVVAVAMCFSLSQAAFALGPTAVVNYDFSEGTGSTPQDTTPNNNDGDMTPGGGAATGGGSFTGPTPSGGTGYLNSGAFGGALWFTDSSNQFGQFTSNFDISDEGGISLFVNLYDLVRRSSFLSTNATGTGQLYLEKQQEGIGDANEVLLNSGGTTHTSVGRNALTANTWHHIVYTWSQSGGTQELYVNGVLQPLLNNGYAGQIVTDLTAFRFGSSNRTDVADDQFERRLRGGVDDIAFYSSRLTSSDINVIATGSAAAVTANQVVYWNLDDAIGTTIAPSDGGSVALNMLVGAQAPGTQEVTYLVNGGPTLAGGSYAAAQTLDAVNFSGAQVTNNKISVEDSASMDFDKTQGSVVVWVNLDNQFNRMGLLRDSTGQMQFEIHSNGRVFFDINGRTEGTVATDPGPLLANSWMHLAFVWDNNAATSDIMQIFVNGTLQAHDAVFGTEGTFTVPPNTGDWLIGQNPSVLNRNFDGQMADFAMFDVALTAGEINDIILNGALATWTPVQEPQPGTGGGGGAIPEPASLALVGLSAFALLRRRRA